MPEFNISKKSRICSYCICLIKILQEKNINPKDLSADKYFIYMKMALEGDNIKLIESF